MGFELQGDDVMQAGAELLMDMKSWIAILRNYSEQGRWQSSSTVSGSLPYLHHVNVHGHDVQVTYTRRTKLGETSFVFEVEVDDPNSIFVETTFVVKVAKRYSQTAHQLLGGDSRHTASAPTLYSIALINEGQWYAVFMDNIENALSRDESRAVFTPTNKSLMIHDVSNAIKLLHDSGLEEGRVKCPIDVWT